MSLRIPITKRIRKYGYIYWNKERDDELKKFLKNANMVEMWFENTYLGEKKVDWKYRRISIGWSKTRSLSDNLIEFQLHRRNDESIRIVCK